MDLWYIMIFHVISTANCFISMPAIWCPTNRIRSQQCGCPPSMPAACPALCCLVWKPFHRARFGCGSLGGGVEIS